MDGMCDLSKGVREEGLAEGLEKGHLEGQIQMASSIVISLMKTTIKSMGEVLDMADIDKAIRPEVEKAVKALIQSDR
jgi:flagellar biosynthesis/type III secretory pathway protein FliH